MEFEQAIYYITSQRGFLSRYVDNKAWWSDDFTKAMLFRNNEHAERYRKRFQIDGVVTEAWIKVP